MDAKAFNAKLSNPTVFVLVSIACVCIGAAQIKAPRAKEPSPLPPQKLHAAECIRCHSDQKTIRMMRLKEDGAGYLFNPDGTFKDPTLAAFNPSFKHANALTPSHAPSKKW